MAQHVDAKKDPVLADGGVLAGSTNGISFDPTDVSLWVANVFGATITQIDPESGAVLDRLTAADGVAFPDDLIVASNGDIRWTEIVFGAIFKKPADGQTEVLVPPGGLNSANPLTLFEDETRLSAAGCYGGPEATPSSRSIWTPARSSTPIATASQKRVERDVVVRRQPVRAAAVRGSNPPDRP